MAMKKNTRSGRISPDSGYDFGNKRQYRRDIWAEFRRRCDNSVAESHCILMPSSEGDEIEVALNNGFHMGNLHVIDRNPAIVARLKRRYPQINTYGVSASDACWRIKKSDIMISCANFDFCYSVGRPLVFELLSIAMTGIFTLDASIAVTLLRGREKSPCLPVINRLGAGDNNAGRLELVRRALSVNIGDMDALYRNDLENAFPNTLGDEINRVALLRSRKYRSTAGNQSMLFGIFAFTKIEDEFNASIRFFENDIARMDLEIKDLQSARAVVDANFAIAVESIRRHCGHKAEYAWGYLCSRDTTSAETIAAEVIEEAWKGEIASDVASLAKCLADKVRTRVHVTARSGRIRSVVRMPIAGSVH